MILPLVVAHLLGQGTPFSVDEPNRLALTPLMDGKVVNEEWDRLTDSPDLKTFFQWEPGQVYLGSIARLNQDVVWSLDMNGDGWLVGSDNLEVRLSYQNGGVQATLRKLDATNRSEPKWLEVP